MVIIFSPLFCLQLDFFLKKPLGLLLLLDEEARFVRASEATLKAKLDQHLDGGGVYSSIRGEHLCFRIEHYAGKVTYNSSCTIEIRETRPMR